MIVNWFDWYLITWNIWIKGVFQLRITNVLALQYVDVALKRIANSWLWHIPILSRDISGYMYLSAECSAPYRQLASLVMVNLFTISYHNIFNESSILIYRYFWIGGTMWYKLFCASVILCLWFPFLHKYSIL